MSDSTIQEVLHAAQLLFEPGDLIEVRVPKAGRQKVISGYFRDFQKLAEAVNQLEHTRPSYQGIYWTLNPVLPDLIARADHKLIPYAPNATVDHEILRRRWLPIDLDPKRPAGISSTAAEHDAALALAESIDKTLQAEGWQEALRADSGNGAHLLYQIDLPNDDESTELVKRCLEALAARFNVSEPIRIDVDLTTFNASRIFKVYGTTARKGDSTAERPHRLSRILHVPALLTPVPIELLRSLAAQAPAKQRPSPRPSPRSRPVKSDFDLRRFLDHHGIRYREPVAYDGGYKFTLEHCPFDPSHQDKDAAVFERPHGYGFKCFHNSCADRGWKEFRALFDPDRPVRHGRSVPTMAPPPIDGTSAAEPEPEPEEAALGPADVEAAVDAAIAAADLVAAIRLAPEVAKLRPQFRAVIKVKLKLGFEKKWTELVDREWERALKDAIPEAAAGGDGTGQNSTFPPVADNEPGGPDLLVQPFTDAGNGERIVLLFGHELRYCSEFKKWLVWDGRRWAVDEMNVVRQKGKETARMIYAQAARLAEESSLRGAAEAWARKSESFASISNALGQAASEPGIPISALALDQHPYLLNCLNGVVDLRNGKRMPHNREFLITKLCPVIYDEKAECPTFQRFIEWAMGAETDMKSGEPSDAKELPEKTVRLVSFLQRALGYGLTADVSEKAVFVFYGYGGNNGKTTLLTLFRDMLGRDYANLLLIETIMAAKQTDSTARADMADLRGARFVATSEVSKEDKLNEQRVKYLTQGMGWIKSRRLYENPLEFEATHKLYMDCNYRPKVRGGDDAIWRRLKLVPFDITVEKEKIDLDLPEKLRAELPGILAWAVRGAMQWFKHGLGEPPEVSDAGEEWRDNDDPLREFLEDCCETGDGAFVPVADLMAGYLWWAKESGEKFPLGRQGFNEWLIGKGFKQDRERLGYADGKRLTRIWRGIELKSSVLSQILRKPQSAPPLVPAPSSEGEGF